jgi:hypothetical protein
MGWPISLLEVCGALYTTTWSVFRNCDTYPPIWGGRVQAMKRSYGHHWLIHINTLSDYFIPLCKTKICPHVFQKKNVHMCPWQRRPEVARKENKLPVNRVYLKRIAPYTNLLTRSRWWRSMSRRDARLPSLRCSAWATTRSIDRLLRPRYISWWLMYNDTSAMNTCILFWAVINTWMLVWLSHRLFCSFVYIMLIYISSQKFTLIQGLARTSASSHAWVRIRRYRWTSASVASTWNSFPHLTWLEASVTLLSYWW